MIRLRAIVSLLLAAFWLPASSHPLLEYAGVIHEHHADHDHHDADAEGSHEHNSNKHEAADGKCALSSTHVRIPLPDAVAVPMLICEPGLNRASELHVEPQSSGLAPPGTAPPHFSHGWQFSSRAVLPVRAPSLIS